MSFNPWLLVASAVALAVERVTYAYIWRHPATFRAWTVYCRFGGPVQIVGALLVLFKILQLAVFVVWMYVHGGGVLRPSSDPAALAVGMAAIAAGQMLNAGVFMRLGLDGVLYGNRFGLPLPWVTGFPFSLVSHPQYVGTVLSIWGLFLVMRFPHPDWVVLPLLETIYYIAGSYAESDRA